MTRIEFIRSLSADEIASNILLICDDAIAKCYCKGCDNDDGTVEQCKQCVLKWLKEEV